MKAKTSAADEAFNEMYAQYSTALYKYCLSRLQCNRDDAMECFQESFLVLFRRLSEGEIIENPHAFLYKTASNFIKKKYEYNQNALKRFRSAEDIGELADSSQVNAIIGKIDFELFEQRLDALLNEDEKTLFELRYIQELKAREVAQKLQITVSNCTVRLSRLRKKIITNLNDFC